MMENLKYLFLEATEDDAVHDVVFNVIAISVNSNLERLFH